MADRCYVLVLPDGKILKDPEHGERHFPTEEIAREGAYEYRDEGVDLGQPKQLDYECLTVECHECGYVLDEDDCYFVHFKSLDEATEYGWTVIDGVLRCQDCPPPEDES